MNSINQIKTVPEFIAYINTARDYKEEFTPTDEMIKKELNYGGLRAVYYMELKAIELLNAMYEIEKYQQNGVYAIDILRKTEVCDPLGYIEYEHVLRYINGNFYILKREDKAPQVTNYNPQSRHVHLPFLPFTSH